MSFIDSHGFPAGLVLRVLRVPTSTYYDWRARQAAPSRRELDDAALLEQIVKIRGVNEFVATYGSPRAWLELRRQGVRVGRKRVERVMREPGLQGTHLRRGWKHGSTRQNPAHRARRTDHPGPQRASSSVIARVWPGHRSPLAASRRAYAVASALNGAVRAGAYSLFLQQYLSLPIYEAPELQKQQ